MFVFRLVTSSNGFKLFLLFWGYLEAGRILCRSEEKTCTLFSEGIGRHLLIEQGSYSSPFFFLTPSTKLLVLRQEFLSCSSLERNSLNNFTSCEVFFFVLVFSWSSLNHWISFSENFTNLSVAINRRSFGSFVHKLNRARREMTSLISSLVRIWKILGFQSRTSHAS